MSERMVWLNGVKMTVDEALLRLGVMKCRVRIERAPDGSVTCAGIPLRIADRMEPTFIPRSDPVSRESDHEETRHLMIRPATRADIPALIEMGRAMHAESPRYRALAFDEGRVRALAGKLIPQGLVFVADVGWRVTATMEVDTGSRQIGPLRLTDKPDIAGMAACIVTEHFFTGAKYVSDLLLYVRTAFRGTSAAQDLVLAIEMAGAERGATECVLGVSTEVHPEATAAMYERMGYARSGISLRKAL